MKIVLASASERRQELMKRITDEFYIIVSNFDEEQVDFSGNCSEYVLTLAEGKAKCVAENLSYDALVIGCDTVVFFNGKVLEKPKNKKEAFDMLKSLSGNTHQVYSGLTVINMANNKIHKEYVVTDVTFSPLTDNDIEQYIATGEPMDKAGAYGIQGKGGIFVERINGCFYNVVGLPLNKLKTVIEEMGVNL